MKTKIGLCKNCNHQICKVSHQKGAVKRLFNGDICHSNGLRKWAVICRVSKCGCLKPEMKYMGQRFQIITNIGGRK